MKSFEEELKELAEWLKQRQKEIDDTVPIAEFARDGPHTEETRKAVAEYNRRLRELKKKYNK